MTPRPSVPATGRFERGTAGLAGLAAAGTAAGALARAAAGTLATGLPGSAWVTLGVNALGCVLMGLLVSVIPRGSRRTRVFLGTGVLGGFTTFSAFSLDTVELASTSSPHAVAILLATPVSCVLGAVLGVHAGRMLRERAR